MNINMRVTVNDLVAALRALALTSADRRASERARERDDRRDDQPDRTEVP